MWDLVQNNVIFYKKSMLPYQMCRFFYTFGIVSCVFSQQATIVF